MAIDVDPSYCYIDSHCHFDFSEFNVDRQQVWESCKKAGMTHLLVPGVEPAQWSKAVALTKTYPELSYAVGLHPWFIKNYVENSSSVDDALEQLERALLQSCRMDKCVAIGECGLDKYIDTPFELQQRIMQLHIDVAKRVDMPLIIHCRKHHNELVNMLKAAGGMRGVVHGFSGSFELAQIYWAMGVYIGVGGTITYPRANKTREACRQLPLEAIVIESDAPDMPLHGKQGMRNSPEYIPETIKALAELRQEGLDIIARQTTQNAARLLALEVKTL